LSPSPPTARAQDTDAISVSSAALDPAAAAAAWAAPASPVAATTTASAAPPRPRTPKLIPRVIHQTYRSASSLPPATARLMASWRAANPGWDVRFWDDDACKAFVGAEFPEYAAAYAALPKDVERSDFFRYLVVLRVGGLYADIDTECRADLDALIHPGDTLVVGWENEFPSPARAAARQYARTRQVLQWVFAGAPGHPALRAVCDHIAAHANATLSSVANLDTLERTGPGAWTDAVLAAAGAHPPASGRWPVRILPRVSFGAHPKGYDGVSAADPRVLVLHHFLGSWKKLGGWGPGGLVAALRPAAPEAPPAGAWPAAAATAAPAASPPSRTGPGPRGQAGDPAAGLYPVWPLPSIVVGAPGAAAGAAGAAAPSQARPHAVLVPLVGAGEPVGGEDPAAALTAFGGWQPGGLPARGPTPTDALVSALVGRAGGEGGGAGGRVLLDLGAGVGAASLAAAAAGHAVIAAEAGPASAAALAGSIAYNGFGDLVKLHRVVVGGRGAAASASGACVGGRGAGGRSPAPPPGLAPGRRWAAGDAAAAVPPTSAAPAPASSSAAAGLADGARGYPLHPTSSPAARPPLVCPAGQAPARRTTGDALVPAGTTVGAVRISAPGWEGEVVDGLGGVLGGPDPPAVVVIEVHAALLASSAPSPPSSASALIRRLAAAGYTDVSHSGPACGARWAALTRRLHLPASGFEEARPVAAARRTLGGGGGTENATAAADTSPATPATVHGLPRSALAPPTWCRLVRGDEEAFEAAALGVALTGRTPPAAAGGGASRRGVGASVSGVGGGETVVFVRPAAAQAAAAAGELSE
jgi:hypothetical protein